MADVFISYSRKDLEQVAKLSMELSKVGISFWLDTKDLRKDKPYDDQIPNAIKESKVVLMLISENSLSSPHVKKELRCGESYKKPFILLMLENVELREAFAYHMDSYHRIDASQDWNSSLKELIASLKSCAGIVPNSLFADVTCPLCRSQEIEPYDDWLTILKNNRICRDFAYKKTELVIMTVFLQFMLWFIFFGTRMIFTPDYIFTEEEVFEFKIVIVLIAIVCGGLISIGMLIQSTWEQRRRKRIRQHISVKHFLCKKCRHKFKVIKHWEYKKCVL